MIFFSFCAHFCIYYYRWFTLSDQLGKGMNEIRVERRVAWEIIFGLGGLAGIAIVGLYGASLLDSTGILDPYTLLLIRNATVNPNIYFYFFIQTDMGVVLFLTIGASTQLGLLMCAFSTFFMGVTGGVFLSAAVARYGLKGVFLVMISVMPQIIFYIPAFYFLFLWCEKIRRCVVHKQPDKAEPDFTIILQILLIWIGFFVGCGAESYINPFILGMFLQIF